MAEVKVRFEDFEDFVLRCSRNVSETGMFLDSKDPRPPGSELLFELAVEGGTQLVRGTGQVVWTRDVDEAPALPSGMGIRFTSLDSQSRKLINWLIDRRLAAGETDG